MKIVVIVVTYKGMRWYKECFDSLRNSTIPVQTIVIDNKSEDGTAEFIRNNYPEIHLVESQSNLGFGKANNIGFRYAIEQNADYIFLLNQDAWVKPDTIEKLVENMKENPEYGILSPMHLNREESAADFGFAYYLIPAFCPGYISDCVAKGRAEDKIYPIKFVNAALWMISRDCLNKIGGFDPIFAHYGEDMDYTFRCNHRNLRIGIYPYAFGIHDRQPKDQKQLSFSKLKYNHVTDALVILKNIDQPFVLCTYRSIVPTIFLSIKKLFKLSFKESAAYIASSISTLFLLRKAYKHRQISKQEGLNFL